MYYLKSPLISNDSVQKRRGKVCIRAKWPIRPMLIPVSWHEVTRSISTPPWMGRQSIAGLPTAFCRYPFIHLGGERHRGSKVSCPRTQHNVPGLTRTRTIRSGVEHTNHEATASPTKKKKERDLKKTKLLTTHCPCVV